MLCICRCLLQGIELVYVDDPRSMAGVLGSIFTGALVKMDVGHIIFSRIGPLLDKLHEQYCE
jgi:hypothetical protein